MVDDPLKDLPRLGDEALAECMCCNRLILATEIPVFYRVTVQQCGVDKQVVDQRVGLAMQLGGGRDGLALSAIMGAHKKPVVVMSSPKPQNVCQRCAASPDGLFVMQIMAGSD